MRANCLQRACLSISIAGILAPSLMSCRVPAPSPSAGAAIERKAGTPPAASTAQTQSPNILLVISDDQGWDKIDLEGVMRVGSEATRPKTPALQALATEGVVFDRAYAYPYCSPTRATLLTGRYGFRTGIGSVVRSHEAGFSLPHSETTLPEVLQAAGYSDSQIGKWHLGSLRDGAQHARDTGWSHTSGSLGNLMPKRGQDYARWNRQVNGRIERMRGEYATVVTTDDAIARTRVMAEPWFLWLSYNAPHEVFHMPPAGLYYTEPGDPESVVDQYNAMVESLDMEIGRLMGSIDPDVLERTVVIFVADNGTPRVAAAPPLDQERAKGALAELGVHVPLIVAGPVVEPRMRGRVSSELVATVDVFSTIVDIAGARVSDDVVLDGVSFRPALGGEAGNREFVYSEMFRPNGPNRLRVEGDFHEQMISDGRFNLIREQIMEASRGGRVERVTRYSFRDQGLARLPGTDGPELCPCPENLDQRQLSAYESLETELLRLTGDPASGPVARDAVSVAATGH